jgi:hypothetical protein
VATGKSPIPRLYSGVPENSDPTNLPGQYPVEGVNAQIFGGPLPSGTGAPGSAGAPIEGASDPTNLPGQIDDGLTGLTEAEINETGAPGSQGAENSNGGADSITYTEASAGINPYRMDTVADSVGGPADWTAANSQGYASGGPQLPGIKGNEPQAGVGPFQPGNGGSVMRGGRAVRG